MSLSSIYESLGYHFHLIMLVQLAMNSIRKKSTLELRSGVNIGVAYSSEQECTST